MCENPNAGPTSDTHKSPRHTRRKLWELSARFHCPVIGTCLTIRELGRLYRQCKFTSKPPCRTDYDLHLTFVSAAGQRIRPSKLVQKTLDRKYQITIRRVRTLKSAEALAEFWDEAVSRGDIAGAFWATLTHPAAAAWLLDRVYAEVHMLSHLAGASTRVSLARLPALETRNAELERDLRDLKFQTSRQISERQKTIEALGSQLERAREDGKKLANLRQRVTELEGGERLRSLQRQIATLQRDIARSQAGAQAAELEMAHWWQKAIEATARIEHLEQTLRARPHPSQEGDTGARVLPADREDPGRLDGRCVLYVGGRSKLTPHLRRMVSGCGGRFVHHDGGLSDGWATLNNALERADAVMCPLDCISHNACSRLKQVCKERSKPLVLLRGAGLGAFTHGLRVLQEKHLVQTPETRHSPMSGVRAIVR